MGVSYHFGDPKRDPHLENYPKCGVGWGSYSSLLASSGSASATPNAYTPLLTAGFLIHQGILCSMDTAGLSTSSNKGRSVKTKLRSRTVGY